MALQIPFTVESKTVAGEILLVDPLQRPSEGYFVFKMPASHAGHKNLINVRVHFDFSNKFAEAPFHWNTKDMLIDELLQMAELIVIVGKRDQRPTPFRLEAIYLLSAVDHYEKAW